MPQDTTIYWDGEGRLPPELGRLPLQKKREIIALAQQKRAEKFSDPSGTYLFLLVFIAVFSAAAIYSKRKTRQINSAIRAPSETVINRVESALPLVYTGEQLLFSDELIATVLIKRFPYYNQLDERSQSTFISRLQKFIASKTFVIHDHQGYKEMPILISATAIQISFGLSTYLLPGFSIINVYPEAFISTEPFLRVLIGNVSGNTINLSWLHLLEGLHHPEDGQQVGMHEIAHALYYETFVRHQYVDRCFRKGFGRFNEIGKEIYTREKATTGGLYSSYALKDFQEFWAESVELFFERPLKLKTMYPDFYEVMGAVLNQDPATWPSKYIT